MSARLRGFGPRGKRHVLFEHEHPPGAHSISCCRVQDGHSLEHLRNPLGALYPPISDPPGRVWSPRAELPPRSHQARSRRLCRRRGIGTCGTSPHSVRRRRGTTRGCSSHDGFRCRPVLLNAPVGNRVANAQDPVQFLTARPKRWLEEMRPSASHFSPQPHMCARKQPWPPLLTGQHSTIRIIRAVLNTVQKPSWC